VAAADVDQLIGQRLLTGLWPEQPLQTFLAQPALDQRPEDIPRRASMGSDSIIVPQMNRAEKDDLNGPGRTNLSHGGTVKTECR
jgi:hypothetical protein